MPASRKIGWFFGKASPSCTRIFVPFSFSTAPGSFEAGGVFVPLVGDGVAVAGPSTVPNSGPAPAGVDVLPLVAGGVAAVGVEVDGVDDEGTLSETRGTNGSFELKSVKEASFVFDAASFAVPVGAAVAAGAGAVALGVEVADGAP